MLHPVVMRKQVVSPALAGGRADPSRLLVPHPVRQARNPVRGGRSTHDQPHTNRVLAELRHKSARRLGSAACQSVPRRSDAREREVTEGNLVSLCSINGRGGCRMAAAVIGAGASCAGSRVLTARREAGFPLQ